MKIFIGTLLSLVLTSCGSAVKNESLQQETQTEARTPAALESPNQLEVTAKFREKAAPGSIEDNDGSTLVFLMANITDSVVSNEIHDFLNLAKASTHEFLSPSLGGCVLTTYLFDVIGPANEILNFGGRDPSGSKLCKVFFQKIRDEGLQMKFTDVPLLNGGHVIREVTIHISNK